MERNQDEIKHQSLREARTVRLERALVHKKEKQSKRAAAITPQTQGRLETASVKGRTSEMIVNPS
ncbi:hypothetical protein HOLDEFILI_01053 [Holdemania filiformis DSM 12042]|uniref:Uncharacterized protein n=1 Tax=Holdemania filiformis DSM 12042 TaxID=545696 RepID=B9Y5H1_9FIRM|nr:hypothetical protein HOLDEFILI_01053 [Holdemania filiformis DSM 12042]